jgi:hypothetical protein
MFHCTAIDTEYFLYNINNTVIIISAEYFAI